MAIVATVSSVLVLQLILVIGVNYTLLKSDEVLQEFETSVKEATKDAKLFFKTKEPQLDTLQLWLKSRAVAPRQFNGLATTETDSEYPLNIYVVDAGGRFLCGTGTYEPQNSRLEEEFKPFLEKASQGSTKAVRSGYRIIVPGSIKYDNQVKANFIVVSPPIFEPNAFVGQLLPSLLSLALVSGAISAAIGGLTGSIIARGIRSRLRPIEVCLQNWEEGNLSVRIEDNKVDEIGRVSLRLNQMAAQLKTLIEYRNDAAVRDTKNRIAQDLHDNTKQQAFAMSMLLSVLQTELRNNQIAQANGTLEDAITLCTSLQHELSLILETTVSSELSSPKEDIEIAIQPWLQMINPKVHLSLDLELPTWRSEIRSQVIPWIREALSNAVQHSLATDIEVQVKMTKNKCYCAVKDNGAGFNTNESQSVGLGLASMRSRVAHLAGSFDLNSNAAGTEVILKWEY